MSIAMRKEFLGLGILITTGLAFGATPDPACLPIMQYKLAPPGLRSVERVTVLKIAEFCRSGLKGTVTSDSFACSPENPNDKSGLDYSRVEEKAFFTWCKAHPTKENISKLINVGVAGLDYEAMEALRTAWTEGSCSVRSGLKCVKGTETEKGCQIGESVTDLFYYDVACRLETPKLVLSRAASTGQMKSIENSKASTANSPKPNGQGFGAYGSSIGAGSYGTSATGAKNTNGFEGSRNGN